MLQLGGSTNGSTCKKVKPNSQNGHRAPHSLSRAPPPHQHHHRLEKGVAVAVCSSASQILDEKSKGSGRAPSHSECMSHLKRSLASKNGEVRIHTLSRNEEESNIITNIAVRRHTQTENNNIQHHQYGGAELQMNRADRIAS